MKLSHARIGGGLSTCALLAAALALPAQRAAAVDYFWVAPINSDWEFVQAGTGFTNWSLTSGVGTPALTFPNGANDTATIEQDNAVVVFDDGAITVGDLSFSGTNQRLDITGSPTQNATFTHDGLFTNAGTVRLTSTGVGSARLSLSNGMTNNGTVHAAVGTGSSLARNVIGNVTNNGTFDIDATVGFALSANGAAFTNDGAFNNDGDVTFASGSVFTQQGGSLDNQGSFFMLSDTFNFDGGTVTGNALTLQSSTLNIGAGSTGAGSFNMTSSGGLLTGDIASGQTVTMLGIPGLSSAVTAQGNVNSAGVINLDNTGNGTATLAAAAGFTITNDAGGVFNAREGTGTVFGRILTTDDFVNNGTFNVEDQADFLFNRSNGEFTNNAQFNIASDGEVDFGTLNVFTQQAGNLDNQGDFHMVSDTFNFNGGTVTGNALTLQSSRLNIGAGSTGAGRFNMISSGGELTGDIAAGQTVTVLGIPSLSASVTAMSDIDNAGVINLDNTGNGTATLAAAATFTITNEAGGVFNAREGTGTVFTRVLATDAFVNDGTFNVEDQADFVFNRTAGVFTNNAQVSIAAGGEVDFGSNNVFTQAAGNLDNQGDFLMVGDTFNFDGGTITGNALTLQSSALNIGVGSFGAGSFHMTSGSGVLTGDIAAAQTVTILGIPGLSASVAGMSDIQVDGTLALDNTGNGNATLSLADGFSLVNAPGGMIHARTGTGTAFARDISAQTFINHGTVTIDPGVTTNLFRTGGHTTNNNQFTVAATGSVVFGSNAIFTQGGGNLNNLGSFTMVGDTFNFNGGTITGNAVRLQSSTLNIGIASTGAGAFEMTSSGNVLTGTIAAGQTVSVLGVPGLSSSVSAPAGLTNNGTLNLDNTGNGQATLTVTGGLLANNGTLNLLTGGTQQARTVTAGVVNNGDILVQTNNASFNLAGATHVSSGTITFEAGSKLTVSGAGTTFTNLAGGTIAGSGELQLDNSIVLMNEGTIAPGASAGDLLIDADLVQTATAEFDIEIAGLTPGTGHDRLTVEGDVTIDGTLTVNVIDGFAPTAGDVYDVFDFDTSSGTFHTINLGGVGNGNTWDLTNLYSDGQLIVIRSGDLNSDGIVGVEDLDIILANWNDSVTAFDESMGDATGDGFVDDADLQIVLDQFGNTTFPGSTQVPEPGTLAMLSFVLLAGTRRRRDRSRLV
ncbi:PEP-CTERM sorting domain-containing protein [Phycisphaeraceae bacterium D3-23]